MANKLYILGISAFYHDSAIAILDLQGEIIFASHEERFSRVRHDKSFPSMALKYACEKFSLDNSNVIKIVFYENPSLKLDRQLNSIINAKSSRSIKGSTIIDLSINRYDSINILSNYLSYTFPDYDFSKKLMFANHHDAHAASSFFASGFQESALMVVDGVGEYATTSMGYADPSSFKIYTHAIFPNSLGLFYSAFTRFCGFKVNSGEYKFMGLAPYGNPKYLDLILEKILRLTSEDNIFDLNASYFNDFVTPDILSENLIELFKIMPLNSDADFTQDHLDLAASVQKALEIVLLRLAKLTKIKFSSNNLCYAGGVALNCVANTKLRRESVFSNLFIQPASGDAGGSLGAAYLGLHEHLDRNFFNINSKYNFYDRMKGAFLGASFSSEEIDSFIEKYQLVVHRLPEGKFFEKIAELLNQTAVIGIFQGPAEFGPRALGGRSIIADPRCNDMLRRLNQSTKKREPFRPFAPAVLDCKIHEWFDSDQVDPYMLTTSFIKENKRLMTPQELLAIPGLRKREYNISEVSAITHVDFSARVQSVSNETNPFFYKIISAFFKKTGIPMVINTSFNVRGQPIVNDPLHALECFCTTDMDVLVLGDVLVLKEEQSNELFLMFESQVGED
jgi:carbamoyltransferase